MKETSRQALGPALSLDTWAVLLSLGLALLVRFGVLKVVPW
jgi:hypothetical protein